MLLCHRSDGVNTASRPDRRKEEKTIAQAALGLMNRCSHIDIGCVVSSEAIIAGHSSVWLQPREWPAHVSKPHEPWSSGPEANANAEPQMELDWRSISPGYRKRDAMPEAGKPYRTWTPSLSKVSWQAERGERVQFLRIQFKSEEYSNARVSHVRHHLDLQARLLPAMGRNDRRGAHSNSSVIFLSDRPLESNSLTFVFRLLRDVNTTGRTGCVSCVRCQ